MQQLPAGRPDQAQISQLKKTLEEHTETERASGEALRTILAALPNIPLPDVPQGADEHDNVEVRRWGEPYPDTKIDATELVHGYRKRGLASAVVHPGWVYGPGDRAFLPQDLVFVRPRLGQRAA
mgnify:CR=1 FL=1